MQNYDGHFIRNNEIQIKNYLKYTILKYIIILANLLIK